MDGIVPLSFGHPLLSDLRELKKSYLKVYTVIEKGKDKLLRLKNQAVAKNERLRILWSIYTQPITFYKLNGTTKVNQKDSFDFTTTRDYILKVLGKYFNFWKNRMQKNIFHTKTC